MQKFWIVKSVTLLGFPGKLASCIFVSIDFILYRYIEMGWSKLFCKMSYLNSEKGKN